MPGIMPVPDITQDLNAAALIVRSRSTRTQLQPHVLPSGAHHHLVMQQAINVLTFQEQASFSMVQTSRALMKYAQRSLHFEYCASPMVHSVTGQTISSYKKLMNYPATAEVWQMAFGRDFGGMLQGDNKTGQKGMNAMFMMTHKKIAYAVAAKNVFTYENPVNNY
jgi:hypothetical protein